MKYRHCFHLFLLLCPFLMIAQSTTINYQSSSADFANPERGFYRYSETRASNYTPLSATELASWRMLHPPVFGVNNFQIYSTLTFRYFFLDDFKSSPITQNFLIQMEDDFAAARQAGTKIIVRMAYTNDVDDSCGSSFCPPYGDAPKSVVLNHIEQLKPIFFANKDVIAVVQMGFIGIFGENYYTDFFGDASMSPFKLFNNNWNDRNEVLGDLLDAVPTDRMIQVRYPQLKQRYLGGVNAPTTFPALTIGEAYGESDKARLGFHNDCLLASPTDFGTYTDYGNSTSPSMNDTTRLKPYKAADSKYVAVGGETCSAYEPFDNCEPSGRADSELRRLNYSYLNSQFNYFDVNEDWIDDCMEDIKRELGYRFALIEAEFSNAARPGQQIEVEVEIDNEGYATPYNPRGVELVLRHTTTQAEYFVSIESDPRLWRNEVIISQNVCIPSDMPLGSYELFLHLPDLEATLYGRSEYAIRLASRLPNGNDVWENTTGYNRLGHTLIVNNSANRPSCGNAIAASSCTDRLIVSRIEQSNYKAANLIESTATFDGNVTFEAGQIIVLEAPFHAQSGSNFTARIDNNCADLTTTLSDNKANINTRSLNNQNLAASILITPNPSNTESQLQYELTEPQAVTIDLIDTKGQVLQQWNIVDQFVGRHQLQLPSLPVSLYYIRLRTATTQQIVKWMVTD
ncbi:MAG: DUF4832 domain-containing protein [Bacteroidota bacterium]